MNKKLMSLVLVGMLGFGMIGCNSTPLMESDVVSVISLDAYDRFEANFKVDTKEMNDKLVIHLIAKEVDFEKENKLFAVEFMEGYNSESQKILVEEYLKEQKDKLEEKGYDNDIILVITDLSNNIIYSLDTQGNEKTTDGYKFEKLEEEK